MTSITVALAVIIAARFQCYRFARDPLVVTQALAMGFASSVLMFSSVDDAIGARAGLPAIGSFIGAICSVLAVDRLVVWAHKCARNSTCERHDRYVTVAAIAVLGGLYVTGAPFDDARIMHASGYHAALFAAGFLGLQSYRLVWLLRRAAAMRSEVSLESPRRITATALAIACALGLVSMWLGFFDFDDDRAPGLNLELAVVVVVCLAIFGGVYPIRRLLRLGAQQRA